MTRYTLEPGRTIARDGRPLVRLDRVPNLEPEDGSTGMFHASPTEADTLAREIVAALNGVAALREAAEAALSVLWNPDEYDRSLAQPLRDALIDALRGEG
jgi:hypothetical protein